MIQKSSGMSATKKKKPLKTNKIYKKKIHYRILNKYIHDTRIFQNKYLNRIIKHRYMSIIYQ